MDVTREELPDTMAALRLSGMEISDLTMELSDLGFVFCFLPRNRIYIFVSCLTTLWCCCVCFLVAKASLKVLKAQHGLFAWLKID